MLATTASSTARETRRAPARRELHRAEGRAPGADRDADEVDGDRQLREHDLVVSPRAPVPRNGAPTT